MTFRNAGGRGVVLWAALCVLFPLSGHASQAVELKFATVQRGELSGIEERREVVVRTAAEWSALWKQHSPGQKPPAIDFTRSMVAGVFLGSRPSGGFAIDVTSVQRDGAEPRRDLSREQARSQDDGDADAHVAVSPGAHRPAGRAGAVQAGRGRREREGIVKL